MAGYQCTTRIVTTLDETSTIITTHDEPNYSTVQASPRGPCLSPAVSLGGSDDQLRPPCVPGRSTRLSGGIGARSRRPKIGVPDPPHKL